MTLVLSFLFFSCHACAMDGKKEKKKYSRPRHHRITSRAVATERIHRMPRELQHRKTRVALACAMDGTHKAPRMVYSVLLQGGCGGRAPTNLNTMLLHVIPLLLTKDKLFLGKCFYILVDALILFCHTRKGFSYRTHNVIHAHSSLLYNCTQNCCAHLSV